MTIDLKTVKHISKLSRISVTDEKAKKLAEDLNLYKVSTGQLLREEVKKLKEQQAKQDKKILDKLRENKILPT